MSGDYIMSKKILSIEGGGIRGVIPAYICMKIEEDFGKPISEIFDFISGTSTGAILGGALACGVPAKDAFGLYVEETNKVFKSRHAWYKPWAYATTPKYDREILLDITRKIYGADTKITETKVHFMCTAYNSMNQTNEFFTSWEQEFSDLLLVDAIGRSWAAPFYFGKWVEEKEKKVYSDGGVGIYNNVTLKSLLATLELNWVNDEKYMLNLGCGNYSEKFSYNRVVNWMNLKEAWYTVFDAKGARDNQIEKLQEEFLSSRMVPNLEFHTYEPTLTGKIYKLDGAKYIPEYIEIAEKLYKDIDISPLIG